MCYDTSTHEVIQRSDHRLNENVPPGLHVEFDFPKRITLTIVVYMSNVCYGTKQKLSGIIVVPTSQVCLTTMLILMMMKL
jgi:hypothetical protein